MENNKTLLNKCLEVKFRNGSFLKVREDVKYTILNFEPSDVAKEGEEIVIKTTFQIAGKVDVELMPDKESALLTTHINGIEKKQFLTQKGRIVACKNLTAGRGR